MKYISSKDASEILGVNISTLKRWTDNGTLKCSKTAGGHRKFTIQHIRDYYKYNDKAEIVREKGTNRKKFLLGEVDKYTWEDLGSSYLPSELISSFLFAQLEKSKFIKSEKLKIWSYYYKLTFELEEKGYLRRPKIKKECDHNGHIFYVVLREDIDRTFVINKMKEIGIYLTFHYIPLHSSTGGKKYGRFYGDMQNTNIISRQIVRFPMWIGITPQIQERIIYELTNIISIFFSGNS